MRIFVTGSTGFVGSAIVQELLKAGHQVVGLVRSDANAAKLQSAGGEPFRGSLTDLEGLKRAAAASDGVIHTAHNHDFVNVTREAAAQEDREVIEAIGAALAGSNKPFLISAGMAGRSEDQEADSNNPRNASEKLVLGLAAKGVRSGVVRLPPTVHGDGDRGLVPLLIGIARQKGVSAYLADGQNRWPAVHRLDAAKVYVGALLKGPAATRYHAVAEEGVPTKAIAEVIGRKLNLPVVSKPREEAAAHFGFMGFFFGADLPTTSNRTRELLGWAPTQVGLLEELEHGTYFTSK